MVHAKSWIREVPTSISGGPYFNHMGAKWGVPPKGVLVYLSSIVSEKKDEEDANWDNKKLYLCRSSYISLVNNYVLKSFI